MKAYSSVKSMIDRLSVGIAGHGVIGERRWEFIDQNPNLWTFAISDKSVCLGV